MSHHNVESGPAARSLGRLNRYAICGKAGIVGLGVALAFASPQPASAQFLFPFLFQTPAPAPVPPPVRRIKRHYVRRPMQHEQETFGAIPKGPLQIIISINQQRLRLYSDGTFVAEAPVATGVPSHPTPTGVFDVIGKDRFHRSNIYSNAPMPFMQRITWSGVALHEGEGLGHAASHGCIRMPGSFAARLYALTKLGARVIIAHPELTPVAFADQHLFVHRVPPPAVVAGKPVQTAQTLDADNTTDAVDAPIAAAPDGRTTTLAPALASATPGLAGSGATGSVAADPIPGAPVLKAPTADVADGSASMALPVPAEPDQTGAAAGSDPGASNANPGVSGAPAVDPDSLVPLPPTKPVGGIESSREAKAPIAIFISRKEGRIYVRQNFAPLFDAPITIAQPDQPLGTHVFTALDYLDGDSVLRWNVISFPAEQPARMRAAERERRYRHGRQKLQDDAVAPVVTPATPQQALARIDIPQSVVDQISALIVPGSSLVVSDHGLGPETGEGTDFIVITH